VKKNNFSLFCDLDFFCGDDLERAQASVGVSFFEFGGSAKWRVVCSAYMQFFCRNSQQVNACIIFSFEFIISNFLSIEKNVTFSTPFFSQKLG